MTFKFKTQLSVGDSGEKLFLEHYPKKIQLYTGREYDFDCLETGRKLELKTDTYPMIKTPNFFMERYSDSDKKSNGGPWRAAADSVDDFFYMFVSDRVWFHFANPVALVEKLDKIIKDKKLKPMSVMNIKWRTVGYKILRSDVSDLYEEHKF